jgi:hypothetical protein
MATAVQQIGELSAPQAPGLRILTVQLSEPSLWIRLACGDAEAALGATTLR